MLFVVLAVIFMVSFSLGDDKILHVSPGCPSNTRGIPHPMVRADVPVEITARCKNGDQLFTSSNGVKYVIAATLEQVYFGGHCQYYKKKGVNTYLLEIAIGWSEEGNEVYTREEIRTITCVYDEHGNATSSNETIGPAFIAPVEKQHLKGDRHLSANFSLQVIDVLNRELSDDHLHIGRLVRLKAVDMSGTVKAFRALSCVASNNFTSYAILRAGCGDGLVFGKHEGFQTVGKEVYSPYFDTFKLQGRSTVNFECNFTVCESTCDGDSCKSVYKRARRDSLDYDGGLNAVSRTLVVVRPEAVEVHENPNMSSSTSQIKKTITTTKQTPISEAASNKLSFCHSNPERSMDIELITVILVVFGSLLLLSFTMSLYLCCKYELAQMETVLSR